MWTNTTFWSCAPKLLDGVGVGVEDLVCVGVVVNVAVTEGVGGM